MNSVLYPSIITKSQIEQFIFLDVIPWFSIRDFSPLNLFNIIKHFLFLWSNYSTSVIFSSRPIFLVARNDAALSKRMDGASTSKYTLYIYKMFLSSSCCVYMSYKRFFPSFSFITTVCASVNNVLRKSGAWFSLTWVMPVQQTVLGYCDAWTQRI